VMNFLQCLTVNKSLGLVRALMCPEEVRDMSFGLYLLGYVLLIIGIAYGASMANVPTHWIAVIVIAMLGIGIMTGVSRTRMKDPS
jgi:hypothetical protein